MVIQKKSENGPEKSGPDLSGETHIHVGIDDDLIARADAGDKFALCQLYGHASGWARGGMHSIPEPLGTWIADRLLEVARVLDARKNKDMGRAASMKTGGSREIEAALAVALRARRAGKQGRAPNPKTDQYSLMLARDVLHFMTWENLTQSEALRRVVSYNAEKRMPVTADAKTYEAAWTKHREQVLSEAGIQLPKPKK